jgi:nickel and cobalt resistance protein CnrR
MSTEPTPRSGNSLDDAVEVRAGRPLRTPGDRATLHWGGAVVTILLAGLAAFFGARLGNDQGRAPRVPLSDRVFELLGEELSITPAQQEAIGRIGDRYAPIRERLRSQSRAVNIELAQLMAEEQQFGPRTEMALERLQAVMGDRLKLSMEYMLEVRALLTPDQRQLFDRRVAAEAAQSR